MVNFENLFRENTIVDNMFSAIPLGNAIGHVNV
jgi:hypothetical protein